MKTVTLLLPLLAAGTALAQDKTKLAVGTPPIAEVQAAFIGKDEGMFEKNGLNIEFLPTGSNQTLIAALVSGSHQIVAISPTVLLQAVESGIDLTVIANCGVTSQRTAQNHGLAIREGVAVEQPSDIKGKKIGTPSIGGTLDILFRQWLRQNQLSDKDVTFIEVPIPSTADVLKGGTIDGVIAGQPSLGRAASQANGKIAFSFVKDLPENLPFITFVSTRDWAAENTETVKAFRAAAAQAADFGAANPDKARQIVSKYTKLPIEVLNRIDLPVCKTVPAREGFDYLDKAMRESGLLRDKIDTAKLIAP